MSANCEIKIDCLKIINYEVQQNRIPFVRSIQVYNGTDSALENCRLRVSFTPEYAQEIEIAIGEIQAGAGFMEISALSGPFEGTEVFNTMRTLFNAVDDGNGLSMNMSKSQFIEACKAWLDTNESLLPKVKQMITDGEIPLRHRYEKDLDLEHQAGMELTINMSEKETQEYIKNIIS